MTAGRVFLLTKSLVPGTSECDVLQAIATTGSESAFDLETLEVEERASAIWEKGRVGAKDLVSTLIGAELNRIGGRILLALIREMSVEEALRHSDAIPGLLATVVRMNPEVAKSLAIWRGPPNDQRGLFDAAIRGGDVPDDLQRSIVLAMLQAGSAAAAERSVRKFGAVAVFAAMTWFDESRCQSPRDLLEGWRRALSPQTSSLLAWLADSPAVREASATLIADLSNPHSPEVRRNGADVWLKTIANPDSMTSASTRVRLHAFLLAFAFDAPPGRTDELVARTFETVHAALAEGRLADDSWVWIDDHLPTLAIWRNWDRCERLRRGLAERFVTNEWPVAQLVRCAPNSYALRDLLKACSKVDGGNRLLKRIKNAVADDEIRWFLPPCRNQSVADAAHRVLPTGWRPDGRSLPRRSPSPSDPAVSRAALIRSASKSDPNSSSSMLPSRWNSKTSFASSSGQPWPFSSNSCDPCPASNA